MSFSVAICRRRLTIVFVLVLYLQASEERQQVPLSFWKDVSKMNSTMEFYRKYILPNSFRGRNRNMGQGETQQGSLQSGPVNLEATPLVSCSPQNVSVEVPVDPDPSVVRIPPCVMLPRCGGCCGASKLLACLPTSTRRVPVTVYRGVFDGTDWVYSTETLTMDEHTGCDCSCRISASECNVDTHYYSSDECSCRCRNEGQATDCVSPKIWDEQLCRCVCPMLRQCLDNEVFSFQSCSCVKSASQAASPASIRSPSGSSSSTDACASQPCRPGFQAVLISGTCRCQPESIPLTRNWPLSRSARRKRQEQHRIEHELRSKVPGNPPA